MGVKKIYLDVFLDFLGGHYIELQCALTYLDVWLEGRIKGDRINGLYPQYTPFISRWKKPFDPNNWTSWGWVCTPLKPTYSAKT